MSTQGWQRYGCSRVSIRSEERRVGKECRSRRDWSSDVCSSDLEGESSESNRSYSVDAYTPKSDDVFRSVCRTCARFDGYYDRSGGANTGGTREGLCRRRGGNAMGVPGFRSDRKSVV